MANGSATQLPRFDFDTLEVGTPLGWLETVISDEEAQRFRAAVEDPTAEYFTAGLRTSAILMERTFQRPLHHVNAGLDAEFFQRARPGRNIRATARISDKFVKRDKPYIQIEAALFDEDGSPIERSLRYRMVAMPVAAASWSGVAVGNGSRERRAAERAPQEPPVAEVVKRVTLEKMQAFEHVFAIVAAKGPNFHGDAEYARSAGLAEPVASAHVLLAYAHELVNAALGRTWIHGGRLSLRFLRPVVDGDTLVLRAYPAPAELSASAAPWDVAIWCENQKGERVVFGSAAGPRAEQPTPSSAMGDDRS